MNTTTNAPDPLADARPIDLHTYATADQARTLRYAMRRMSGDLHITDETAALLENFADQLADHLDSWPASHEGAHPNTDECDLTCDNTPPGCTDGTDPCGYPGCATCAAQGNVTR